MSDLDLRIESYVIGGYNHEKHRIHCLICGYSWHEPLHPPTYGGHEDKIYCPRCFTLASLAKMVTEYRTYLLEENARETKEK